MRFIASCLALFCLTLPAAFASAQEQAAAASAITRGLVPGGKDAVPPEPTPRELEEASSVYDNCNAGQDRNYFDCGCMSLKFLELRSRARLDPTAPDLGIDAYRYTAREACPNTVGLAGETYTFCMSWAPKKYRNYEEFCTCYANDYAQRFAGSPTASLEDDQHRMTASLLACKAGQPTLDRLARKRVIETMKRDGTYETLFPGAVDPDAPKEVVREPLPKSKRSTSQILSDQLIP